MSADITLTLRDSRCISLSLSKLDHFSLSQHLGIPRSESADVLVIDKAVLAGKNRMINFGLFRVIKKFVNFSTGLS